MQCVLSLKIDQKESKSKNNTQSEFENMTNDKKTPIPTGKNTTMCEHSSKICEMLW